MSTTSSSTTTSTSTSTTTSVSPSSDTIIKIKSRDEYTAFKSSHIRSVVFYSAKWCVSCDLIKDFYRRLAKRCAGHDNPDRKGIAFGYVDIEKCGLDFSQVPVFVTMYKGKQINSLEGADKTGLKELIQELIKHKD